MPSPYLQNLSTDTATRTLQLLEAIARQLGLLPPQPPNLPPPVPTITKSIGTSSRDYSTITSWEADLDNGAVYASGDTALGECYDDSAFNEAVTINGGGTVGLAAVKLSVASGHRHTGIAGTGARIVRTAAGTVLTCTSTGFLLEWLEIDMNGNGTGTGSFSAAVSLGTSHTATHCIVHGTNTSAFAQNAIAYRTRFGFAGTLLNCLGYSMVTTAGDASGACGIHVAGAAGNSVVYNSTVYNISSVTTTRGIYRADTSGGTFTSKNNIACDAGTCMSGESTESNNLSSDTTAGGSGSLTSKAASDQFVSTTGGSEDLHLKSGADAIDAGVDLVTTPAGVNFDIDNRDRDALGDTWDIGADEFVASGDTSSASSLSSVSSGSSASSLSSASTASSQSSASSLSSASSGSSASSESSSTSVSSASTASSGSSVSSLSSPSSGSTASSDSTASSLSSLSSPSSQSLSSQSASGSSQSSSPSSVSDASSGSSGSTASSGSSASSPSSQSSASTASSGSTASSQSSPSSQSSGSSASTASSQSSPSSLSSQSSGSTASSASSASSPSSISASSASSGSTASSASSFSSASSSTGSSASSGSSLSVSALSEESSSSSILGAELLPGDLTIAVKATGNPTRLTLTPRKTGDHRCG